MAQSMGSVLPEVLMQKLEGGALYRAGDLGLPVVTLDEQGWPHVAMAAGAAAVRPDEVWVALGGHSGSLRNAERDGRITLLIAGPETLYYVKGRAAVGSRQMQTIPGEAALRVTVTEVYSDQKSFVTITGGVSYRYHLMKEDYMTVLGGLLDELKALAEEK